MQPISCHFNGNAVNRQRQTFERFKLELWSPPGVEHFQCLVEKKNIFFLHEIIEQKETESQKNGMTILCNKRWAYGGGYTSREERTFVFQWIHFFLECRKRCEILYAVTYFTNALNVEIRSSYQRNIYFESNKIMKKYRKFNGGTYGSRLVEQLRARVIQSCWVWFKWPANAR